MGLPVSAPRPNVWVSPTVGWLPGSSSGGVTHDPLDVRPCRGWQDDARPPARRGAAALWLSRDEWMLRLYGGRFDDLACVERLGPGTALMRDVALEIVRSGSSLPSYNLSLC